MSTRRSSRGQAQPQPAAELEAAPAAASAATSSTHTEDTSAAAASSSASPSAPLRRSSSVRAAAVLADLPRSAGRRSRRKTDPAAAGDEAAEAKENKESNSDDVEMADVEENEQPRSVAAPAVIDISSSPSPPMPKPKRAPAKKRASRKKAPIEEEEDNMDLSSPPHAAAASAAASASPAAAAAASPAAASARSSSSPALRRTSRQLANPKLAVRSYAELADEADEDVDAFFIVPDEADDGAASEEGEEKKGAAAASASASASAAIEIDDDGEEAEDDEAYESKSQADDEYREDDSSASDAADEEEEVDPEDEEFSLTPIEKKKKKKKASSSKSKNNSGSKRKAGGSGSGSDKKKASARKRQKVDEEATSGDPDIVVLDEDEDEQVNEAGAAAAADSASASSAAAAKPTSSKKPTAAQRKRSLTSQSAAAAASAAADAEEPTISASQEARDAAFRAFATAPVKPARKSTTNNDSAPKPNSNQPSKITAPASSTLSSAAVQRETVCIDDDDIMEIAPFVPSSNKTHRTTNNNSSSAAAAAAAWSNIGLSAAAASSSSAKPASSSSSSSAAVKSASKSSVLKANGIAKGSMGGGGGSGSSSSLLSSDKEARLRDFAELLGGNAAVTRMDMLRYLEGAEWKVDVAVGRMMDSAWFQSTAASGAAGGMTQAAGGGGGGGGKKVSPMPPPAAKKITEIDDDDEGDSNNGQSSLSRHRSAFTQQSSYSAPAGSKTKSAAASAAATAAASSAAAAFADSLEDDNGPAPSTDTTFIASAGNGVSGAPPKVLPSWDRKLLLILNVNASSTCSGKNVLQVGDELEFRREKFDPLGWSESEMEREREKREQQAQSDREANQRAMAAASGSSSANAKGGKKGAPSLTKAKSKNNALVSAKAKRPTRILRFTKKGAAANTLELGSVPQILAQLLAPLFDAFFVDLVSHVLYVPATLDYGSTITLSLSVFVLPSLFMWTPPARDLSALQSQAAQASENPFWKKVFARKEKDALSNLEATSSGRWNPVEAFVKLLKECDVKPLASTEQDIDEAAAAVPVPVSAEATAGAAAGNGGEEKKEEAVDVEMESAAGASAAAAGASSSSANEVTVQPVYEEELEAAKLEQAQKAAGASSSSSSAAAAAGGAAAGSDDAADNTEGATISRFQLDSLYASATAACLAIPEADAPPNLKTTLRPYQRQALYWMQQRERGDERFAVQPEANDDGEDKGEQPQQQQQTVRRHALWDEYALADPEDTRFYLNPFSNELSLAFPPSTGSCRGGLLADEMGMGKTVMCISLLLSNHPANVLMDLEENERVKKEAASSSGAEEKREDGAAGAAAASATAAASSSSAAAAAAPSNPLYRSLLSSRRAHRRSYMFRDGVVGSTLVVCPMSLLSQWRDEIARFSDLDCLIYYGGDRGNKGDRKKVDFAEYDVVLTSYGVVAAEYRVVNQAQSSANNAFLAANPGISLSSNPAALSPKQLASLSPLLATNFWRLVIDEAHIVRNRHTETAKAIFSLRGERRWCLSGTIIQNRVDDVYSCLHFLREEPWASWGWWAQVISKPFEQQDSIALARLRAILTPLMLRRTKSMRLANGESIVALPPRVDEIITCEFSREEKEFYLALYNRSKAQFEGFVSTGIVSNKYVEILTLLLRLRQCCDHPFLILNNRNPKRGGGSSGDKGAAGGGAQSQKEFEEDIQRFIHKFAARVDLNKEGAPSMQFLESLTQQLKQQVSLPSPSDANEEEDSSTAAAAALECPICLCPPELPVLTECAHMACRECLTPLFNERGFARCPMCRAVISRDKLFLVPAAGPSAVAASSASSSSSAPLILNPEEHWAHSSKTARLMLELNAIRSGSNPREPCDPTAKIIIFSQWTMMLDLVEIPLRKEKFSFLRLDGSLAQKERESVLKQFGSTRAGSPQILLISLKAGGVGLNLVMANYCFFLDCWWNPSVEEQAAQRVHRIGQRKTTFIKRFVVEGTIELRILELQEKKKCLAQALTADTEESKQVRMQDLVDLFKES